MSTASSLSIRRLTTPTTPAPVRDLGSKANHNQGLKIRVNGANIRPQRHHPPERMAKLTDAWHLHRPHTIYWNPDNDTGTLLDRPGREHRLLRCMITACLELQIDYQRIALAVTTGAVTDNSSSSASFARVLKIVMSDALTMCCMRRLYV